MEKIQKITSKAIIEQNGKILCLRDKNRWELPGGKPNFGEVLENALVREVAEETSLDITVGNIVHAWSFIKLKPDIDEERQYFVIVYVVKVNSGEIILSPEHKDFAWIPFNKIDDLNMRGGYKDAIKKYKNLSIH